MNEVETGLRLVVALHVFWHARGHVSEARAWLDRLLAATRSVDVSPLTHVAALTAATWLATTQADFQNAVAYGEAAVGLTRAIRQPAVAARAMMFLGCAYEGEYLARARDCCMQAVTLFRAIDDPEGIAMALGNLGVTLRRLGDFQAAGALFEEQLAREQGRGYIRGARALADLGDLDLDWNDRLAAVTHYRESLALFARAGDVTNIALCTTALGLAIAGVSAYSAARLLGMAASLRKPTGLTAWSFDERRYDRTVADVRTHLGEAAFADAWAAGRASSVDQLIAEVVAVAAHAESKRSPTPEAARFGLTPRELEVLRGLVERLTDREIAARLSLSPRTIGWYVTGILTKLDVSSRRAAAAKASEEVLL